MALERFVGQSFFTLVTFKLTFYDKIHNQSLIVKASLSHYVHYFSALYLYWVIIKKVN